MNARARSYEPQDMKILKVDGRLGFSVSNGEDGYVFWDGKDTLDVESAPRLFMFDVPSEEELSMFLDDSLYKVTKHNITEEFSIIEKAREGHPSLFESLVDLQSTRQVTKNYDRALIALVAFKLADSSSRASHYFINIADEMLEIKKEGSPFKENKLQELLIIQKEVKVLDFFVIHNGEYLIIKKAYPSGTLYYVSYYQYQDTKEMHSSFERALISLICRKYKPDEPSLCQTIFEMLEI